ncbi:MAG: NifB/NifX family molybdenum-iron cluster-binding protein [Clostridia bacterium]|nr:NifB/NifX family molybdenum-iron cluster-binding protein [Clostridia bacterium]MBQ4158793.1 NifB/NifX family molybdenum-iron cluster-binding protein [Clostridia bacterium]
MKIAATYENGRIFQHFGHTEQFKIYETADGAVTKEMVVNTCGSGHGALAGFLKANGVEALICGGIGGGAQIALAEAGIKLYAGVAGSADEAVQALLSGTLAFDPAAKCNHHEHHHDHGHECGSHGCHEHHDCGHHH